MSKLKLGELFAGFGGLGMAVEEVFDAELTWYAEFDDSPSKIMAHHWPGIPNHRDVTTVDWASVEPVDIISGGSPCQDLSAAGRRAGMTEGTRSNLWVSMREAIATIKPTYVVWENVRGAYSAKATSEMEPCPGCMGTHGGDGEPVLRALGRVLGDLSDLGYDCQWRGLRAADVGAPHGRYRVFILATLRSSEHPHGCDGGRRADAGSPGGRSKEVQSPRASNTNGEGLEGQRDSDGATPTERHRHVGSGAGGHASDAERLQREAWGESTPGQEESRRAPDELGRRRGAHSEPDSPAPQWLAYEPAIRRWEALRGTAPAPTELTAKGKHRLNAAFAEWMMGLAPGHVTGVPGLTRNEQLKAIGNGVVPQQAIAALKHMLGAS